VHPTFSWTPTSSQVGTHTVTFNVNDSHGGTASETITITVTNAPTTTATPTISQGPTAALGYSPSLPTAPPSYSPDQYEPNNSPESAPVIAQGNASNIPAFVRDITGAPPPFKKSISANFHATSDTSDWFTISCWDTFDEAESLQITADISDGPTDGIYKIVVSEKSPDGLVVRASSYDQHAPTVHYDWTNRVVYDDAKILLIEVRHVGGAPSSELYKLNIRMGH
jgi:Bacterial Ig domain